MPDNFNIEDYKILLSNFKQIGNTLYWANKPIVSSDENTYTSGEPYFVGGNAVRVEDGGTGVNGTVLDNEDFSGILKANGKEPFSIAIKGVDYSTPDSVETLTNKTIDLATDNNTISNLGLQNFTFNLLTDDILSTSEVETIRTNFPQGKQLKGRLITDHAVKNYVDETLRRYTLGLQPKEDVDVVSVSAVNRSSIVPNTQIDGVSLSINSRVLLVGQASASENGIYIVTRTGLARANDANSAAKISKAQVYVSKGLEHKGTTWFCENNTQGFVEWSTAINWKQIAVYPIYYTSVGSGITLSEVDNYISIDKDIVLYKGMEEPLDTKYGGTGNKNIEENGAIVSKVDDNGNIYLDTIKSNKTNTILTTDAEGKPKWSDMTYPTNIIDKALLYADNNEVKSIGFRQGVLFFDDNLDPQSSNSLPSNITYNGQQIYSEGGKTIKVEDGGTGVRSIEENTILYGIGNNKYAETPLTRFGREIIKLNSLEELTNKLNLGNSFGLDVGTTENTVARGNHTHENYVTTNGVQYFTHAVRGVDPILDYHLATKKYVDSVSTGHNWQKPVKSMIGAIPANLYLGDRYLILDSVIDDRLSTHTNEILNVIDTLGTISYEHPVKGWVIKIIESGEGYIFDGDEWILYSTNEPHNALSGLQGGNDTQDELYHLSKSMHDELSGLEIVTHHQHRHKDLVELQGGDGKDYYHLSASQYALISNTDFKYHNKLFNLQGGNPKFEQYYHLDFNQYIGLTSNDKTTLHTHSHDDILDIKGSTDAYHLSAKMYSDLTGNLGVRSINAHTHSHNNAADIQGGTYSERYHLDKEYYNIVLNLKNTLKYNHNDFNNKQGGKEATEESSAEFYHLSLEQYSSLTDGYNCDLHTHSNYLRKDGSVAIEVSPICPEPIIGTDIATKNYVDSRVNYGLIWSKVIRGRNHDIPPTGIALVGDRYLIPVAAKGSWTGKDNSIAIRTQEGWSYIDPANIPIGTAAYIKEDKQQVVWNGTEWVTIAAEADHSNLSNLYGGKDGVYFHISAEQYNDLVSGENCSIHYHKDCLDYAEGVLSTSKGGTGVSNISKGNFLYATVNNVLEQKPLSEIILPFLSSSTLEGARQSLQIGSLATQNANNVTINNGVIENLKSPLKIKDGGTGLNEIPNNSVIYTDNNGNFVPHEVKKETLDILNKTRDDIIAYLGLSDYSDITKAVPNGRSKLFYLVAFGN